MDRTVKNNKGFTLIEVLMVMAVVAVLALIAINKFTSISTATSINKDLNTMATFLQQKRLQAFTQKTQIDVSASAMQLSAIGNPSATDFGSVGMENNFTPAPATFIINTRGLFSTTGSIRLTTATPEVMHDCVVIANTRVRMGEWDGASCVPK